MLQDNLLLKEYLIARAMMEFDRFIAESQSSALTHENKEIVAKYPLFIHNLLNEVRDGYLAYVTLDIEQMLTDLNNRGSTPSIEKLDIGFGFSAKTWVNAWWIMSRVLDISPEMLNGNSD